MRACTWSRLRLWLAAAALAAGVATACNTPSVPLPPPLVGNMNFDAGPTAGTVVLKSPPESNIGAVRFSIYNRTQQVGVIVESAADGSFTSPPFAGADGDSVQVYYEDATGALSTDRCTTLHVGAPLIETDCL